MAAAARPSGVIWLLPLGVLLACLAIRASPLPADVGWWLLFAFLVACVAAAALGDDAGTLLGVAALSGVLGSLALAAGLVRRAFAELFRR